MGNQLLDSKLIDGGDAYAIVTRDDSRLFVMVINASRESDATVEVQVPKGVEFASEGRTATFSHREYFWDFYKHEPRWSRKPHEERVELGSPVVLKVPPFSIKTWEIPFKKYSLRGEEAVQNAEIHPMDILLPETAPADLPVDTSVPFGYREAIAHWRKTRSADRPEG